MEDRRERLRALPSVDRLATAVARAELADRRAELLNGAENEPDLVVRAQSRLRPSYRRVLNATGVVVHTNLGRAPLAAAAREAVARAARGYANLELDLETGERGSRHDHVEGLLRELTGAESALVVNNCAAATLLAVAALAGDGRELVISRGQAIEIGGEFRIPDVVAQAGARMLEVGTTNRTRLADYAAALGPETAAILRAHPSNFRAMGFVESVEIEDLCGLGVPVVDDVGSGVLADDIALLADEPAVRRSVRAGAAVVCFSGDKLLGGPRPACSLEHTTRSRPAGGTRWLARCGSTSSRSPRWRQRSRSTATPSTRARRFPCWPCSPRTRTHWQRAPSGSPPAPAER